jgi:hypothetical protein
MNMHVKPLSLIVVMTLVGSPAFAQQQTPIRASIERAVAAAAAEQAPSAGTASPSGQRGTLFWTGLAVGIAGITTSALGLTALRTDNTSTGNAPAGTYQACVAQRDSNPIYASNQCGVLKGKNLKLLWGGVAISGVGAVLMVSGMNTSAELSPGSIGLFRHWRF